MFDDKRPPPTLTRLIALMVAGYKIDEPASKGAGSTIWLDHPAGKRVSQPTLLIYESGLVVGLDPMDRNLKQIRIPTDDDSGFWRFISSVPKPTWWEINKDPFYLALSWAILIAVGYIGAVLLEYLWHAVFNKA